MTVQANQETETVESSLDKELDEFKVKLIKNGHPAGIHLKAHPSACSARGGKLEEESQEDECLTETILVEQRSTAASGEIGSGISKSS